MKLSNVTQIRIPEGVVQRVATHGVTIWEAPSADGFPIGYTQCEYIQCSGTQYVDTGIICTQDTRIEVTFTRESSSSLYLYGATSSDNAASVTAYLTSSGNWRFGNSYARPNVTTDKKHTAVIDRSGITFNGGKLSYYATIQSFTAPVTLALGCNHNAGGTFGTTGLVGKIYSFKLWAGDVLVADYIPCINPQDVYGFWDSVARVFLTSQSADAFTGG